MAVLKSDILRQRTVDVWPRKVCTLALNSDLSALVRPQQLRDDKPSSHIPYPNISVAPTTDKCVLPRHHGPNTHDVTLKRSYMVSQDIKNMNLSVVQSHHNVFPRQVQARHDPLVWRDVLRLHASTFPPRGFNHVAVFEMRSVGRLWSWPLRSPRWR